MVRKTLNHHLLFSSPVVTDVLLLPLFAYISFLQSSINHSVGVFLYEQGDFSRATEFLDKSSRFRRQLLDDLRVQADDYDDSGKGLSKLFNAVIGGMKSNCELLT